MRGARRRRARGANATTSALDLPRNWFDAKTTEEELLGKDYVDLDDPVALAGRFLADSKWQEKADVRMARCEQLLSSISARSGKPGSDGLLSFHSKIFMLGGGDARKFNEAQPVVSDLQRMEPGGKERQEEVKSNKISLTAIATAAAKRVCQGSRRLSFGASEDCDG